MEEDLFPHFNTLFNERGLEEERRLCYVGITRAKKHVIFTSARTRRTRGQTTEHEPSRFIGEIPADLIEAIGLPYTGSPYYDEYYQEMPDYEGGQFNVGDLVEHSAFGTGRVNLVSGSGEKLKVAVRFFRDRKQRHLLVKFAGLRKK